ncbi:MAG: cytochrome c3 family protein [Burkholderiaceae bacterium]
MKNHPDDAILSQINALQKPLRGRRVLSWALFIVILVVCLAIPIAASVWPSIFAPHKAVTVDENNPPRPGKQQPTALGLDVMWNPGHLASAHQPWAHDCKICHSTPFERVKDVDCMACHQNVGDHVNTKIVNLPALHEVRCATCHRDHQDDFGLAQQNKRYTSDACTNCHANIHTIFAQSQTGDVKDFATAHPEFRLQIAASTNGKNMIRVRQNTNTPMVEPTSLKFPHDVHLAAGGVSSPNGKIKMTCDNCHKPNADGSSFQPVTMKDHCQSCHALKFEPAVSNREVPHGSVDEVLSTLREFYSYVGTNGIAIDKQTESHPIFVVRPGKSEQPSSFITAPGNARSRAIASATELFEKTSCIICHEVSRVAGTGKTGTPGADMPQWKIAPIAPQHAWIPKAEFSHVKHLSAQCTDCHAAKQSKSANEVLIPSIKVCRDCHAGKKAAVNKVVSDCGLCHGFHSPSHSQSSALSKTRVMPMAGKP